MPLATHPRDARVKCVTQEHLQQVARLHERPLQAPRPLDAASPPLVPSQMGVPPVPENQMETASTACSFLTSSGSEADLIQKLSGLETKIATRESAGGPTHAGAAKGAGEIGRASSHDSRVPHASLHGKADVQSASAFASTRAYGCDAAASRASPRRTPCSVTQASSHRILRTRHRRDREYHKKARCICSPIRERGLTGWLPSPRSVSLGLEGARRAQRGYKQGQQTLYWSASRCVRRHTYKHYLGMTESLTLASLEHTASRLPSDVDAREVFALFHVDDFPWLSTSAAVV
jgi:hypothetical protein